MVRLLKQTLLLLVIVISVASLLTSCASGTAQISRAAAQCSTIAGLAQPPNKAAASGPDASSVYFGTSEAGLPTGTNGSRDLYALRASDGALRWRCTTSTRGGFGTTPLVDHDVLYALAGSLNYFKDMPPTTVQALYALRRSDGAQLWQFAVQGINGSGPLLANNVIYIAITTHRVPQSNPSLVFALRASDGMLLWQAQVGDGGDGRVLLAVNRDTIYAATEDGLLTALRTSDGTQQWQYQTDCHYSKVLITRSDALYFAGCSTVSAFRAGTGTLLWRFQTGDAIEPHPLLSDDVLYVGSSNHTIYAVRVSDGRLLWQNRTGDFSLVPATVMDGVIYITAENPSDGPIFTMILYAFRASDGKLLWHFQRSADESPLVASHGVIYLGTFSQFKLPESIVALRASDGKILWRYQTDAVGASFSGLSNGVLYVSSASDTAQDVSALRTSDGVLLWHYRIPPDRAPLFLTEPVTDQVS